MTRRSPQAEHAGAAGRITRRKGRLVVIATVVFLVVGGWWWTEPARTTRTAAQELDRDATRAEQLAAQVVENRDPHYAPAWIVRSRALLRLKRRDEATGCFAMIAEPTECDEGQLLDLAEDAVRFQVVPLTNLCLRAVIKQGGRSPRLSRLILETRPGAVSQERLKLALADFTATAPTDAASWRLIAKSRRAFDELAGEIVAYREALQHQPDPALEIDLKRELAQRLIEIGEFREARPLIEYVLQSNHGRAEDHVRMAHLLRADGDRLAAITRLDTVLSQNKTQYDALLLRGALLKDEHRYEDAAIDLLGAVQLSPRHPESRYRLAQVLQQLGRTDEAARHFQEHARLSALQQELLAATSLIRERPQDVELMTKLADVNEQLGYFQAAAQWKQAATGK